MYMYVIYLFYFSMSECRNIILFIVSELLAIIHCFSEIKFLASESALSNAELLAGIQKILQLVLYYKRKIFLFMCHYSRKLKSSV